MNDIADKSDIYRITKNMLRRGTIKLNRNNINKYKSCKPIPYNDWKLDLIKWIH